MKIMMTGATGFVGATLVKSLKSKGITVHAVNRQICKTEADVDYFVGDFEPNTNFLEALIGCNVVIHLAARVHIMKDSSENPADEFMKTNVQGTESLAKQALQVGVKRFIYISSIKVNGEATEYGQPFTELNKPLPVDSYSISKYKAEQSLLHITKQTNMDLVIIRPPLVYGPNVKANFASMLRAIKFGFPLPLGAIYNKRSFVYVENLVSLILCCIEHPAAANQIFLVSDGKDLSTTELIVACAKALNQKARLLPIPKSWIKVVAAMLGKKNAAERLCDNLQVDISKAQTHLGWTPPISIEDGLKATVRTFL